MGHERVNALALAHLKELRKLAEVLGALLEADDGIGDDIADG